VATIIPALPASIRGASPGQGRRWPDDAVHQENDHDDDAQADGGAQDQLRARSEAPADPEATVLPSAMATSVRIVSR
jgi:hypothetical protein